MADNATNHTNLKRLAGAARFLPHRLSARLAQSGLEPWQVARVAAHLPPRDAAGIARHLALPFLADVARHLPPADAAPLLPLLPLDTLRPLARRLVGEGAHETLAGFLAHLPPARLPALAAEIAAPADLLRIAALAPRPAPLADLVAAFDDAQLRELLRTAHALGLWPVVLRIGEALPPVELARLGRIARGLRLAEATAAAAAIRELQLELALGPMWEGLTAVT